MKVLVTGAAGMLADSLVPALRSIASDVLPTDINVSESGCSFLDVREFEALRVTCHDFRPDLIVHLAAETNVDLCELDRDHAYHTNALGTQNVALMST